MICFRSLYCITQYQNLKRVYGANRALISQNHQPGSLLHPNSLSIMRAANDIHDRQDYAFRINLEFSLRLVYNETDDYRYFKIKF